MGGLARELSERDVEGIRKSHGGGEHRLLFARFVSSELTEAHTGGFCKLGLREAK